jgi:hypothetical protein
MNDAKKISGHLAAVKTGSTVAGENLRHKKIAAPKFAAA